MFAGLLFYTYVEIHQVRRLVFNSIKHFEKQFHFKVMWLCTKKTVIMPQDLKLRSSITVFLLGGCTLLLRRHNIRSGFSAISQKRDHHLK